MALIEDNFGSEVFRGAAQGPGVGTRRQHLSKPEVAHLKRERVDREGEGGRKGEG